MTFCVKIYHDDVKLVFITYHFQFSSNNEKQKKNIEKHRQINLFPTPIHVMDQLF